MPIEKIINAELKVGTQKMPENDFITKLYCHIQTKKSDDPTRSYTAQLFKSGPEKIARKLNEESTETLLELLRGDKTGMIQESADLLYHLVVAWVNIGITPEQIAQELTNRQAMSGLEEKAARKAPKQTIIIFT